MAARTLLEYYLEWRKGSRMVVLEYLHWHHLSSKAHFLVQEVWQGQSSIYGLAVAFWDLLVDRRPHHCSASNRLTDLQIAYYWTMAVVVLKRLTVLSTRSEVFALVLAPERPPSSRKQVAADLEFPQGPLHHRCWCVHYRSLVTEHPQQFGTIYHLAQW